MNKLNTFNKRLSYGKEAEKRFLKVLKDKNIKYIETSKLEDWTPYFDLKNGDVIVGENKRVDVKRGRISLKCIKQYEGEYFAITDHYMDQFSIIKNEDMKEYVKNTDIIELPSGSPGIKVDISKIKHQTLKEWLDEI